MTRDTGGRETGWPDGYFDIFGALRDVEIERPPQPDPRDDSSEERISR